MVDLAATAYAEPGPYPVGVTTLALPSGPRSRSGTRPPRADGEVTYDTRDFVPEAVRALLTADIPAGYTFDGDRDVPDVGRRPVPAWCCSATASAASGCSRRFLTSHLASHGLRRRRPRPPEPRPDHVLGGTAEPATAASIRSTSCSATLDLVDGRVGATAAACSRAASTASRSPPSGTRPAAAPCSAPPADDAHRRLRVDGLRGGRPRRRADRQYPDRPASSSPGRSTGSCPRPRPPGRPSRRAPSPVVLLGDRRRPATTASTTSARSATAPASSASPRPSGLGALLDAQPAAASAGRGRVHPAGGAGRGGVPDHPPRRHRVAAHRSSARTRQPVGPRGRDRPGAFEPRHHRGIDSDSVRADGC